MRIDTLQKIVDTIDANMGANAATCREAIAGSGEYMTQRVDVYLAHMPSLTDVELARHEFLPEGVGEDSLPHGIWMASRRRLYIGSSLSSCGECLVYEDGDGNVTFIDPERVAGVRLGNGSVYKKENGIWKVSMSK